ncbi:hypothetical protein Syun_021154 [Stephania yunnanensis]|uniref:Uncharacterized protein n=1 Tax=Stephania yunnanensis TaxID=152371 RepID=A0AAP0IFI1_9MAGN
MCPVTALYAHRSPLTDLCSLSALSSIPALCSLFAHRSIHRSLASARCVAHRSHHRPLLSRVHRSISVHSLSLTSLTAHRSFPVLPLSPMLPSSPSLTALSLSTVISLPSLNFRPSLRLGLLAPLPSLRPKLFAIFEIFSILSAVRPAPALVQLATLIGREVRGEKVEKPSIKFRQAALAKKGEDYFLIKPDCLRIPENSSTSFSIFAIFDGHNEISVAIFVKENLLNHVMSAIPQGIDREEWLQVLPRALVIGFVKTDIEFKRKGIAAIDAFFGIYITCEYLFDSFCLVGFSIGVFL